METESNDGLGWKKNAPATSNVIRSVWFEGLFIFFFCIGRWKWKKKISLYSETGDEADSMAVKKNRFEERLFRDRYSSISNE